MKVLLKYRLHSQRMTGADWTNMDDQACRIGDRLLKQIRMRASAETSRLHRNIAQGRADGTPEFVEPAEAWLKEIALANSQKPSRTSEDLRMIIEDVWFRICLYSARGGGWVLRTYSGFRFAARGAGRWSRIFLILPAMATNGMAPSRVGYERQ